MSNVENVEYNKKSYIFQQKMYYSMVTSMLKTMKMSENIAFFNFHYFYYIININIIVCIIIII